MIESSLEQAIILSGKLTIAAVLLVWLFQERKEKKALIERNKETEKRLREAMENHISDMKKSNEDYQKYVEQFNTFADKTLRDIYRNQ